MCAMMSIVKFATERNIHMAQNRLVGDYPVIGIRPTIDGRRGALKVRESLEDQTMNMAKKIGRASCRERV